ncbi:uncharacterized protein SPSK_09456 [Sporothrix schenckii 1099-18]|uniref:Uncharacterized protein n=2 Tax=Sporothrix schenckii TaxID=29908 RepID=U7Q6G3_SPOS1|nr:uncharacterized protein SPSK_09456 [Sporothrix schenckii 1099-18]ERT03449.1 hypothetical protein HMPREF1624_01764 [Sporothrix schenckii ATCC 58251]KJR84100.1 hypothetical protein SPSK_09456 [Sporothrix schenckii 1099-18]
MSQWTKGKSKQRGPPPALFTSSSPASSSLSLAGGDTGSGAVGGTAGQGQPTNAGTASGLGLGAAGASPGGTTAATSRMPSLPTLQRTTSRLRQEVSNGGGGVSTSGSPPPALSANSSTVHSQGASQGSLLVGGTGGSAVATQASGAYAASGGSATKARAPATAFSLPLPLRHASSTRATDRTDALWAEMQATLEEVELSASEGTRVFGPDHDQKLVALRQAQIALAQAWAQSEADEAGGIGGEGMLGEGELSAHNLLKAATTTATSMSGGGAGGKDDEVSAGGGLKGDGSAATHSRDNVERVANRPLEEETQVDILLARKRREANDRYFQRVNQGVLDVVAKLEDVADAMRAVEQESMDIWGGENDSEQQESIAS